MFSSMSRLTALIVGSLTASTQAFDPSAPIQWMNRVVMPKGFVGPFRGTATPQQLLIKDPPKTMSGGDVPYFTLNPDNSITLKGTDSCIEASSATTGNVIILNRCTGEPTQKWNWIPDSHGGSHVQLKDTDKCLDASIGGGLNGAPIMLWDCESEGTEAWKFEEVTPLPKQGRHMVLNFITLAGLATLSLGALVWQYAGPRTLVPAPGGARSSVEEGGVSLNSPLAVQLAANPSNASQRCGDVLMNGKDQNDSEGKQQAIVKPTFDLAYWAENVEKVQKNADNRNFACNVAELATSYNDYKAAVGKLRELQEKRNANAKLMKGAGKMDAEERQKIINEGKLIKENVAEYESKTGEMLDKLTELALPIPNDTHPDTPVGPEENAVILREHGTPRTSENAEFTLQDHLELGEKLGLLDLESGRKVSGQKFVYYKNGAALLELALVQWTMHEAVRRGWVPIMPPDLVRESVVAGCGFTPRGGESTQIYSVANSDLCLAGTAEIPLGGIFMNETLVANEQFPAKFVAFGHAFRTEAGSAGSESRGIYRVHQFSKVELFAVTRGDLDESTKMMEEIRELEEHLFSTLGLCFRVLDMPTEELGAPAYRKYDVEAWMPGMQKWGEISSCSNCTDFQARRLNVRYKEKLSQKGNTKFAHTLNGTACAVPRMLIAILETYQNEDGSITIPEVLRPYMMGMEVLQPPSNNNDNADDNNESDIHDQDDAKTGSN